MPTPHDRSRAHRRTRAAACTLATTGVLLLAGCGGGAETGTAQAGETPTTPAVTPAVATTVVPPAPRPDGALAAGATCVSAECHATMATALRPHVGTAAGDCAVCHDEDRGDHVFPLRRPGDETCTFCHAVTGPRAYRHAAMDDPGCTGCHDPHGTDGRFLLTGDSVEAVCLQCHLPTPGTHPHGPYGYGECTACHRPHDADTRFLLRGGDGAEHCFTCHTEVATLLADATRVHAPAAAGCAGCHEPHATDFPHALRAPIDTNCFSCHADLEAEIDGATAPHAALLTADRCANCHDPHGSTRPALLRGREDALCLTCHGAAITASDGRTIPDMTAELTGRAFLHGPVAAGDCSQCHNVHGAGNARLLRATFTTEFYAPYDRRNYALCFTCHESELAVTERTTTLTGFRDGALNLHAIHVNRDPKGRTCRTCHAIHGSDRPKHIADSVPFEGSQWNMPIRFEKTADGGSCAPGCHERKTYDRTASPDPVDAAGGGAP